MSYTPRERVLAAMNLQKPDRVPLMCQFSIGSMMQQLKPSPAEFWYDGDVFASGLVELCKRFKFDGILVSLHGHSPDWRDNIISFNKLEEGKQEIVFTDRSEFHSWTDLPMVKYFNKPVHKGIDEIDVENDVPGVIDYIPVSQDLYFKIDKDHPFDIFLKLKEMVGSEYSIHGEITSPFDYLLDLLGYEQALISLILNPEKCKEILQKFTNGITVLAKEMCKYPIDAVKISSPFAGMGFISPEHYSEFVLPYESQFIKEIRNCGKHVYIHTCGHIDDRLELMQQSGASGLECLDPEPVGNVDLEDAFKRIGSKMFIKGNIDSINSLLYADDAKAERDILKIIETGKRGGGFILSTACSIAPMVSSERLDMLPELIKKAGRY
ncbi:MAG: uroporphyrinogen decarboxylase family protein [Bacteroidales bacterium]|nr:uroporphyrinogen decarboxylase family protein [Bacteroidales bacterium]